MVQRRLVLAAALSTLFAISPATFGAGKGKEPVEGAKAQVSAVLKLSVGKTVKLGNGVDVALNQVVPASGDSIGGEGFTEYNLTFSNTSADKELVLSNVTFTINGESRAMVKDVDDIVNQGSTTGKQTATTGAAAAVGYVGGLLGPLGSLASMIGVTAAGNKIYVEDPQKWREELKKRGFQGNDAGASIFPGETATGSVWVKQAGAEAASRIQLYLKQGGSSRLVKIDLDGMPLLTKADAKE